MPEVSDNFIKSAQMLSQAMPALLDKVEENAAQPVKEAADMRVQAEVVADTLIAQGLVNESEKSAAVTRLSDHGEALNLLNRTAQQVTTESLGKVAETEKSASSDSDMRDSDRVLLQRLGFSV